MPIGSEITNSDLILDPDGDSETAIEIIKNYNFDDPAKALRNLRSLADTERHKQILTQSLDRLLLSLSNAPDPDMALNNIERFIEVVMDRSVLYTTLIKHPQAIHILCVLCGSSEVLSDTLRQHPMYFQWLLDAKVMSGAKLKENLAEDLSQTLSIFSKKELKYNALRRFKKREMLRIGLRDLLGDADLTTTTQELSNMADVLINEAWKIGDGKLQKEYGTPLCAENGKDKAQAEFAVMSLGKLGGSELNYSSDIDVIFVYSGDGETTGIERDGEIVNKISNHVYFAKLGEEILRALRGMTEEGYVYRVDLRLRPEGRDGPLARSLKGYETYYKMRGELWERQALIKARFSGGSESLGKAFLEMVKPFVYRAYVDRSAVKEIQEMKNRIDDVIASKGKTLRHVKLGYGGIREIEFITQALQLVYGGQDVWLQERNSLRALHRLAERGYLTYDNYSFLSRAYIFLREVEHRLQILHEIQTHTIPADTKEIEKLAKRLGYTQKEDKSVYDAFMEDYTFYSDGVRKIFDEIFSSPEEEHKEAPEGVLVTHLYTLDLDKKGLEGINFRDSEKALHNLMLIKRGPPLAYFPQRSRQAAMKIIPILLKVLKRVPDPDNALNIFERFYSIVGVRSAYLYSLSENILLMERLLQLFSKSEFLAGVLINQPELIEILVDPDTLTRVKTKNTMIKEMQEVLNRGINISEKLDLFRYYKKSEELRIGFKDVVGRRDLETISRELTILSEVCIMAAWDIVEKELLIRYGKPMETNGKEPEKMSTFIIAGLGKLGGRELNYGSDLDIMFIYSGEGETSGEERISNHAYYGKLGERITRALSDITKSGYVFRVDLRLRPGGKSGPLAHSMEAFVNYCNNWAEVWERQALIKSRVVAGDSSLTRKFMNFLHDYVYKESLTSEQIDEIHMTRKRMEVEIGKETEEKFNIKFGRGGLVDVEFITQVLQLVHGCHHKIIREPNTLEALNAMARIGILSAHVFDRLKNAYRFLRRVENTLRLIQPRSVDIISTSGNQLIQLSRNLGYKGDILASAERKFLDEYLSYTQEIRSFYDYFIVKKGALM